MDKSSSNSVFSNLDLSNNVFVILIIFCAGFLLYGNTLSHDYTQDDAIVIYDNMYTLQGVEGIPGLWTKDTFHGFFKKDNKDKLVSGGRYRPLTPTLFALEVELFGLNATIGHLFNVIWYCILGFVLFLFFEKCFSGSNYSRHFALAASLLFMAHPVHTEVVANIKGRDEIIALLCSIAALLLTFHHKNKLISLVGTVVLALCACLSKENAITFLGILPLYALLITQKSLKQAIVYTLPFALGCTIFLLIRGNILGWELGTPPQELMNNPFLKIEGGRYVSFTGSERAGSVLTSLLHYLRLLIFPMTLTHDYYPKAIRLTELFEVVPLLSLAVHLGMVGLAFYVRKTKPLLAFGIVFYFITFSLVANILFPVGTNMSERFLFMPSIGFIVLLIGGLARLKSNRTRYILLGIILLLYTIRTVTRNTVWKDDFTLFTTDVHNSPNSAKVLNAAGGALTTEAMKQTDSSKQKAMLQEAVSYLQKAISIHPLYKNPNLILGNAFYYLDDLQKAAQAYTRALEIDPNYSEAAKNLAITYRDLGRRAGELENNLNKSINLLQQSISLNPTDVETLRLLGVAHGISQQHDLAIKYFKKVVDLSPEHAPSYLNLSNAYKFSGDESNARIYLEKALSIDPQVLNPNK